MGGTQPDADRLARAASLLDAALAVRGITRWSISSPKFVGFPNHYLMLPAAIGVPMAPSVIVATATVPVMVPRTDSDLNQDVVTMFLISLGQS